MIPRLLNIGIATWLFVAAFAFMNPRGLFINMLLVSLLVIAVEIASMWKRSFRYVGSVLGIWLAITGFTVFTPNQIVMWNNLFCGLGIFVLSMFPARLPPRRWDLPESARRHTRHEEIEA